MVREVILHFVSKPFPGKGEGLNKTILEPLPLPSSTEELLFWMALIRTIAVVLMLAGSLIYWYYRLTKDKKEGKLT